jgi:hypothetical protein
MTVNQSIPSGTLVRFSLKHLTDEEFGDRVSQFEGKVARINRMATFTKMGEKDFEYYDIQFIKSGVVINAVSGFHLELL